MAYINVSIAPQFIYLGWAFCLFVCARVIVPFINATIGPRKTHDL